MRHPSLALVGLVAASLLAPVPSLAADPSTAGRTLPPICKADGMNMQAAPAADAGMGAMAPMDKAHQDLMQGMAGMDANMNEGMMAADLDVAFVCGMIPHHQGAIDMAKAELAHGKDAFARKLAQGIITAQEKEIAEMLDWLKQRSK